MSLEPKPASDSLTIMTELLLPNDTNTLNNLMGGRLMHWMDIVGAIAAQKHARALVVTASVDNVSFKKPVKLGSVVTLTAKVTRAFRTSMEVQIIVTAEDMAAGTKETTNTAFYSYVAVDDKVIPKEVPEVIAESEQEKELFNSALRRRQLRLVLAGRLKPSEASELKAIFS